MKIDTTGANLIKQFEGCKLKAYLDSVKVPTIGWGNTQYENGSKVKLGDTITQERADELFLLIVAKFEDGVTKLLRWQITQNKFNALVSFAYNVGLGNLGKSTLLKKVNANPSDPTISAEFAKWNKAGGKVLLGLTRRRKAESDLYFTA